MDEVGENILTSAALLTTKVEVVNSELTSVDF